MAHSKKPSGKKSPNTGKKRKSSASRRKSGVGKGGLFVTICIIGVILIYIFGGEGNFSSNIQDIFQNTLSSFNFSLSGVDEQAQSLADLPEHGGDLIIYAVDTGNSDCMIIRTPGNHAMIVDAADRDDFKNISSTLKALDIEKLDVAVATHPDADHIGSMAKVVEQFTPAVVYMPEYQNKTATFQNMQKAIDSTQGVERMLVHAPYSFSLGKLHVSVLNPQDRDYESPNDSSVVLLLEYGSFKALLTGDIETEALADILSIYGDSIDVDLLKIAHHGSARSTTEALLDATTPDVAIINAGEGNEYGHPHKETIEKLEDNGITILRTDKDGDIALFSDGSSFEYATAA